MDVENTLVIGVYAIDRLELHDQSFRSRTIL